MLHILIGLAALAIVLKHQDILMDFFIAGCIGIFRTTGLLLRLLLAPLRWFKLAIDKLDAFFIKLAEKGDKQ